MVTAPPYRSVEIDRSPAILTNLGGGFFWLCCNPTHTDGPHYIRADVFRHLEPEWHERAQGGRYEHPATGDTAWYRTAALAREDLGRACCRWIRAEAVRMTEHATRLRIEAEQALARAGGLNRKDPA